MSEFNQFFTIFFKDADEKIFPYTKPDGSMYLCLSFSKAEIEKERIEKENPENMYIIHSIELNRVMFT